MRLAKHDYVLIENMKRDSNTFCRRIGKRWEQGSGRPPERNPRDVWDDILRARAAAVQPEAKPTSWINALAKELGVNRKSLYGRAVKIGVHIPKLYKDREDS